MLTPFVERLEIVEGHFRPRHGQLRDDAALPLPLHQQPRHRGQEEDDPRRQRARGQAPSTAEGQRAEDEGVALEEGEFPRGRVLQGLVLKLGLETLDV